SIQSSLELNQALRAVRQVSQQVVLLLANRHDLRSIFKRCIERAQRPPPIFTRFDQPVGARVFDFSGFPVLNECTVRSHLHATGVVSLHFERAVATALDEVALAETRFYLVGLRVRFHLIELVADTEPELAVPSRDRHLCQSIFVFPNMRAPPFPAVLQLQLEIAIAVAKNEVPVRTELGFKHGGSKAAAKGAGIR